MHFCFIIDSTILKQSINIDPSHNHYEVVRAGGPHTDDNGYCDSAEDVFPGANNVTELTNTTTPANLTIWDGTECELGLYDIQTKDGVVSFRLSDYTETGISSIRTPSEGAEGTWYNLSGLRTAHPTQKGVYLREGKKVVVK